MSLNKGKSRRIWKKDHAATKAVKKKQAIDATQAYAVLHSQTILHAKAGDIKSAMKLVPTWFLAANPKWFTLDADGQLPVCVECGSAPWEQHGVYSCAITKGPCIHTSFFT